MSLIVEPGRVVARDEDSLWVETIQQSSCGSCAAEKGCGQSLVAKWSSRSNFIRVLLEGRDPEKYQVDDEIKIGIPDNVVANGSLFVYLVPLLSLLAASLAATYLAASEPWVIAAGISGLLGGAALVRLHSYLNRFNRRLQPILIDDETPVQWVGSFNEA